LTKLHNTRKWSTDQAAIFVPVVHTDKVVYMEGNTVGLSVYNCKGPELVTHEYVQPSLVIHMYIQPTARIKEHSGKET
jgi:hypothetical protein